MKYRVIHLITVLLLFAGSSMAATRDSVPALLLGGASTATGGRVAPVPQIIRSDVWLRSMQALDSLQVSHPHMISDGRIPDFARVVEKPGSLYPYRELNVLVYLEDLVAIQPHHMYQTHGQYPTIDRATAFGKRLELFARYPFVRRYIIGEWGYAENPRYFRRRPTRTPKDAAFATSVEKYKALQSVYQQALTPKPPQYYYQTPEPYFVDHRKEMHVLADTFRRTVLELVNTQLRREARIMRRGQGGRARGALTQTELKAVIESISQKPVSQASKDQIGSDYQGLLATGQSWAADYRRFQQTLAEGERWLNAREKAFMQWIDNRSIQLLQEVAYTLEQVSMWQDTPLNQTNYAQLIGLSERLQFLSQLCLESPEWPAQKVILERITGDYFNLVDSEVKYYRAQVDR